MTRSARHRTTTPRLEIRLLGSPEVLVDGRPLEVDTRKAVAVLAILAADGRAYGRDELAALLWPESDDAAARSALRRTLSTMRSAIGDGPLLIDRARVDLDRRQVRVDLTEIETAARSEDPGALVAAASLAKGGFLAGFSLRDSPEFDDWRTVRAVAAERAVLTVLDRLAVVAEAAGDVPTAIDAVGRRLAIDPLDEVGHVLLMDLLAASGDRSGALRQYRVCVSVLERELGVAPLATTTARYEAIRDMPSVVRAEPTTSSPPARAAAPPASRRSQSGSRLRKLPFVGRDGDLAAILDAHRSVLDGSGRVVAIIGEAGIGKSRLADEAGLRIVATGGIDLSATAYSAERSIAYGPIVELLREVGERADGEALIARLDPPARLELARLLPALSVDRTAVSRHEGPGAHARLVAAIAEGLTSFVGGEVPGVVRVDDVQWLDPASREALDALVNRLDRYPLLLILAWRPEELDDDGRAFTERVLAQARARGITLNRLGRRDIETLVAAAADDRSARGDLVDRLTLASEGLPLYVTAVLTGESGGTSDPLPGGVRSVLRQRLATVSEATSQVLAAAAVIGRSFDAAMVRHASGRSEEEVVDALEEAARRGLVREALTGFDFTHGALRDLVYEETSVTRRRLLHRRAAEALRNDRGRGARDDLGRLVSVALHEKSAGRDTEAADAYAAAAERAAEVFANREAIEYLSDALALGHPDTAGLRAMVGRLATRLGDYSGAIAALEAAAAAAGQEQLPALERSLARAYLRRGDIAAASHHLDAAAVGAAEAEDHALMAAVLVDRSALRRRLGDLAGAADDARAAGEAAERADDPIASGAAHRMAGFVALDSGESELAIREFEAAVVAATDDPDPNGRIAALVGQAMALASTGEIDAAIERGQDAAAECRRIGDRHLEAAVENQLADLLHAAGRDDDARPHQLRAVAAFAEVGGDPADPDPGIWMLSAT